MNIFFASADEFKGQLVGILIAVLMCGLLKTYIFRKREGRWEYTGLFVDFVKVLFYGLLAYLTLYLQYDEGSRQFSISLINRKLSLGEMLVILLAGLEFVSNVISMLIRFENIFKSNSNHIDKVFDEIRNVQEQEKHRIQLEKEKADKNKLVEQDIKNRITAIRIERLNKIKQKKYKYH